MDAPQVFENVLKQVMDSCLNYKVEMSPFSAMIFLKKTFIRDKSGMPIFPSSSPLPFLPAKQVPQESENYELKHRLRQLEAAYEEEVVQSEATKKKSSGRLSIV